MATKRRNEQHLIDQEGSRLLESCLPAHWVLRPYRPDYGLDFSLEIFKKVRSADGFGKTFETLGEHLFVQLKSTKNVRARRITLYSRFNVEKRREELDRSDPVGAIEVISRTVDSSELATIDRMGVGLPVLLVVADLQAALCYFVCLNDYIDKILVPRHGNAATARSRSIEIPTANVLGPGKNGEAVFRWYGKRAKLYAAFQRFVFQYGNLENESENADAVIHMARYFAERIAPYDFWDDTQLWEVIGSYGKAVRHFLKTGDALALRLEPGITEYERTREEGMGAELRAMDILRLWKLLAHLPGNFEDVCREWFLPTCMGYMTGYAYQGDEESLETNFSRPKL